jgi:hypothetical protein
MQTFKQIHAEQQAAAEVMTADEMLLVARAARMRIHELMETGACDDEGDFAATIKAFNKLVKVYDLKPHEFE